MITGVERGRGLAARVGAGLASVVCACLVLTGCSGSEEPSTRSTASSTASPSSASPSASGSAAPSAGASPAADRAPSLPPARRGRAGQLAFARHVMAVWGYGLRTDDARPLLALAAGKGPACAGCRAYEKDLARRRAQGWTVDFPGLRVRSVRLVKLPGQPGTVLARARVDVPQSDSYARDGSYRNTSKAHPNALFEVLMRHTPGRYRLVAFTVS